jgi:diguanylate cyclase (GGDEF)-like protein/PAS domain S-box-containing protein
VRAAIPSDEEQRLRTLRSYDLLDGAPASQLDRLVALAARLVGAITASVALVDAERVRHRARVGDVPADEPRSGSFAAEVVAAAPAVLDGDGRAGAPLVAPEGDAIGALCVAGRALGALDDAGRALLVELAAAVMTELELRRTARLLAQSQASFHSLIEALPVGVLINRDREVRYVNRAGQIILGAADASDLVGRDIASLVHADYREVVEARAAYVIRERTAVPQRDVVLAALDGREVTAEITGLPVFHEGAAASAALVRDVTRVRRLEAEALAAAENLANERLLLASTLAAVADGVALLDESLRVMYANAAYAQIFGFDPGELPGLPREQFIARVAPLSAAPEEFVTRFATLSERDEASVTRLHLERPHRRVLERVVKRAEVAGSQGWVVVWHDVTAAHELAVERERRAVTDPLTGLLNRRGLEELLPRERARARREHGTLSIVLVDIDNFKLVNDRHGHARGDEVLCDVARCLVAHARTTDVVARWGGEEFAVLVGAGADGARALAERVRAAVEASMLDGDSPVTISAGLTELTDPDEPLPPALARADAHLYDAKRRGRNRVIG